VLSFADTGLDPVWAASFLVPRFVAASEVRPEFRFGATDFFGVFLADRGAFADEGGAEREGFFVRGFFIGSLV